MNPASDTISTTTVEEANLLGRAMEDFSACSTRLQEAFSSLRAEVRSLAEELEAKNRVIEALERQAVRNERFAAMGEMAQRIAHQIRNPLGSIELYGSLLGRDLAGQPGAAFAERIAAAVRNCDLVIQNLMTFADDMDPELVEVDLAQYLCEVVDEATVLLSPRGVALELRSGVERALVRADQELIRQAVLNLLNNAAQAAGEGGRIQIVTGIRQLGGEGPIWFTVSVVDGGPGIDSADLERIFDPLYSTRRGAAGLGLAIAQRVAETHEGLIEVESWLGQGSTFRLSLPLSR